MIMLCLTAESVWNLNQTDLSSFLDLVCFKPLSPVIHFYAPNFSYYKNKQFCNTHQVFSSISVTGRTCALNCKHCNGKLLQSMGPAISPQELYALGLKLKLDGVRGVLVSGGCSADGSVPLDKFMGVLGQFKHELGLSVFVHTGIIGKQSAVLLKQADIDAALIDVIGSQKTIQSVFNTNLNLQDYRASLKSLYDAQFVVVPHVIVGLNEGKLDGEYNALKIIKETLNPAALVIIAFIPLSGTEMAQTPPPHPLDVAKTVAVARTMFPHTPLALGCMRPKGKHRSQTDVLALKAGVDAIAFPSPEAIEYAKKNGYKTPFSSYCCAQLYQDFKL